MNRGRWTLLALAAVAILVIAVVALRGDDDPGLAELPTSACQTPVVYHGGGKPDYLIASDLPLQGELSAQSAQMGRAIEFVLKARGFKAGDKRIGYQACDDSTAQARSWDSSRCTENANAYATNEALLGVVGTFNSGCAKREIPILNAQAVAMVSPENTYLGLTRAGAGTEPGEPESYYPTGRRNYARVLTTDDYQGAALAKFAWGGLGLRSVFVLTDGELYGRGLAAHFRHAAGVLGLTVAGFRKWDNRAASYEPLAKAVASSGADGVLLAGIVKNRGGRLVKELRVVLGAQFPLLAPDGFTPIRSLVTDAGVAADGVYVSVAGPPVSRLTGPGKAFVDDFGAAEGGTPVEAYSVYAAQAATILLDAIAASDGTRQSVVDKLFTTRVTDGIMGSFQIDRNGDPTQHPVTVSRIEHAADGGTQATRAVVDPEASLVAALP